MELFADIRYAGQSYELTVKWGNDFHAEHQRVYGYSDVKRATQVVTLRVRAVLPVQKASLAVESAGLESEYLVRRLWLDGRWQQIPCGAREAFRGNRAQFGPALVMDYGSTTLVPEGWSLGLDKMQNLVLNYRRPLS
jgi:N-methylhydantoinase A